MYGLLWLYITLSSHRAENKLVKVGATGVPIAVPTHCLNHWSPNWNGLCVSTNYNTTQINEVHSSPLLDLSKNILMALMPSLFLILVYRLITSIVARLRPGLTLIFTRFCNSILVSSRNDGTLYKRGLKNQSKYWDRGSVTEPLPATMGLPGGFSSVLWILGKKKQQFSVEGFTGSSFSASLLGMTLESTPFCNNVMYCYAPLWA